MSVLSSCNNKWSKLKDLILPTQNQVGYAWIKYKVDKDYSLSSNAQSTMDASPSPAVIAPNNKFYIVDDHHTISALDYSGYNSVSVTLNIICDKRNLTSMDNFWNEMIDEQLVFLLSRDETSPNVLPTSIDPSNLPSSFSFTKSSKSFSDDPWRSLAGYSRKVTNVNEVNSKAVECSDNKYCQRCFYRGCVDGYQSSGYGVPFFEFKWGYYLNYASYYDSSYWPSESDYNNFIKLYDSLSDQISVSNLNSVDTDEWMEAASYLISLCRAESTGGYQLPSDLFDNSNSLPGYTYGYTQLDSDPDCSSPSCA
eukprot:gene19983-25953_t